MTHQSAKRNKPDELSVAQVGDVDKILGDLLAEMLELDWNKSATANGPAEPRLHHPHVASRLQR